MVNQETSPNTQRGTKNGKLRKILRKMVIYDRIITELQETFFTFVFSGTTTAISTKTITKRM
jgi:hypothetical protein